jgi:hypothetical protein
MNGRTRHLRHRAAGSLAVLSLALAGSLVAVGVGTASLSPPTATMTLRAGDATLGTATETKTADVPAKPPKADIEIAIDTTGSMQASIDQAKADAVNIVNGVQSSVPDTQFAIVAFKDFCTTTDPTSGPGCSFPGDPPYPGDYPEYDVVQAMTASSADVQTAINSLSADGGGDAAETHNLVFDNAQSPLVGGDLGWRSGTRRFVVVISDAEPHGAGSAGFAGCTDTSADPHGLNTATELAGLAAAERTLIMIRQVSDNTTASLQCYQSLAAAGFAGGQAADAGSSLSSQIVSLINAAFANVNDLHLEVASASPAPANASWISFSPASLGPVPAPSTQTFTLTATVPGGTPAGTYSFDIEAVADGVDIGHQALTIVVPEKTLTLTPATASNPIGTSQLFTATVSDVLGPYVGDTVGLAVTAGPDNGVTGSGTTDSSGAATFTLTNSPPSPGTDTLVASDGPLSATASATWLNAPPDCSAVTLDTTLLWPPNHKLVWITASGATDIGDHARLVIDGVTQDEPVNGLGDGDTSPDAVLTSPLSNKAQIRAERSGLGDGRVYRVHYTATDTHGATCTGVATVGVPHDQGAHSTPIDSAPPSYDSLLP